MSTTKHEVETLARLEQVIVADKDALVHRDSAALKRVLQQCGDLCTQSCDSAAGCLGCHTAIIFGTDSVSCSGFLGALLRLVIQLHERAEGAK